MRAERDRDDIAGIRYPILTGRGIEGPPALWSNTVKLPTALHALFWDCRPEALDTDANAPLVLERVLEYGSLASASVRWVLDVYGPVPAMSENK